LAETRPDTKRHRLDRDNVPSLKLWKRDSRPHQQVKDNVTVDCGWGRLIFGHTFQSNELIAKTLLEEALGRRDIAFYLSDPHVILSYAPQDLFLDPSHSYRLYLEQYRQVPIRLPFAVRKLQSRKDAVSVNEIYQRRNMVGADPEFVWSQRKSRLLTYLVAEDPESGHVIGTTLGVDHCEAFADPENGCSLWALAVDPQTPHPGVGRALVAHLAEHYIARGRAFMDLSVMHDNAQAIALYDKLGFRRVPIFCVKKRNPINEPLFIPPTAEKKLNPYADIIVREARRRGIAIHVVDSQHGYFELSFGGRTLACRESLSELTSAVAMSRCDDKRVTRRVLTRAGLRMPEQMSADGLKRCTEFLEAHGRVVVKPVRGEQGQGVSVDVSTTAALEQALEAARRQCPDAILEEMVAGEDVRIIVIDGKVVAAAVRRPPQITGTGEHTIRTLIEKQSRRRSAATGGESRIPLDVETERCVAGAGHELDDVLPPGECVTVRKAANLHTGGTIHDITGQLHPEVVAAAERAAEALSIPVVGLDFIVPSLEAPEYWIIEANERPGLANHEPQPTAERFVDLLFPQTVSLAP
jgi:GNAT-family acetyltransferase (TIGR03103 family)